MCNNNSETATLRYRQNKEACEVTVLTNWCDQRRQPKGQLHKNLAPTERNEWLLSYQKGYVCMTKIKVQREKQTKVDYVRKVQSN